jgi:hypothetical protein
VIDRISFERHADGTTTVTFRARIGPAIYASSSIVRDLNEMQKATEDAIDAFSELARKLGQAVSASPTVH